MLKSLTDTARNLVTEWSARRAAATEAKKVIAAERVARDAVVAHVFEGAPLGTNYFDLTDGFRLKFVRGLTYKLDTSPADADDPTGKTKLDLALDRIEATGNEGSFIVERLVKWEPKLVVSEYKALPPHLKEIMDTVITTKDDAPELEIIAPKDK